MFIRVGTTYINLDRVQYTARDRFGRVCVYYSSGLEDVFEGEDAALLLAALDALAVDARIVAAAPDLLAALTARGEGR